MNRTVLTICSTIALSLAATPVSGQGAQAARNSATDRFDRWRDSVIAAVADQRDAARAALEATGGQRIDGAGVRSRLAGLDLEAERVLDAADDARRFARAVSRYEEFRARLRTEAARDASLGSKLDAVVGPIGARSLTVPQAHSIPGVVFVAGIEYSQVGDVRLPAFAISTNLLGEAAGAAFDLLGSASLKAYFEKNVSAGTTFPMNGQGQLAGQVGLGLGRIDLFGQTLWPVLAMEHVDTTDRRVPASLITSDPTVAGWSTPVITIGIVPNGTAWARDRIKDGKAVPVVVIGYRTEHHYPGDPFSALAAALTMKRSEFRRAGPGGFTIGIAFPLQRADASPE